MPDLRDDLRDACTGRVCLRRASATPTAATTAFGVRLAEAVRDAGYPDVIVAERTARALGRRSRAGRVADRRVPGCRRDGGAPGTVVLLDARDITARFPQVSTHKLSLGTIARLIEAEGADARLSPRRAAGRRRPGAGLSDPVRTTLEILRTSAGRSPAGRNRTPGCLWGATMTAATVMIAAFVVLLGGAVLVIPVSSEPAARRAGCLRDHGLAEPLGHRRRRAAC